MSLLRQRATEESVASTLSDRSPAFARARLVRVTSVDADEGLKVPPSQARMVDGAAKAKSDETPKTKTTAMAIRRGEDAAACRPRTRPSGLVEGPIENDIATGCSG